MVVRIAAMDVHIPETGNQEFAGSIDDLCLFNPDIPSDGRDGAVRQKNGCIFQNSTVDDVDDRHVLNGDRFGRVKPKGDGGDKSKHAPV